MEYLPGGIESGFTKMEKDVFRTRLLHVKGKRVVRVSEVRRCEIDWTAMGQRSWRTMGGVFDRVSGTVMNRDLPS